LSINLSLVLILKILENSFLLIDFLSQESNKPKMSDFDTVTQEIHSAPTLPKSKQSSVKTHAEEKQEYLSSEVKVEKDPAPWNWEKQRVREELKKPAPDTAKKNLEAYQRGFEWYNCIKRDAKKGALCAKYVKVHPRTINRILRKETDEEKNQEMKKSKIWNLPICGTCRKFYLDRADSKRIAVWRLFTPVEDWNENIKPITPPNNRFCFRLGPV
jgi:hypothetical protein